jgi:hypothetical protein
MLMSLPVRAVRALPIATGGGGSGRSPLVAYSALFSITITGSSSSMAARISA